MLNLSLKYNRKCDKCIIKRRDQREYRDVLIDELKKLIERQAVKVNFFAHQLNLSVVYCDLCGLKNNDLRISF